jgi:predicted acylesterase/phospholipase RssA
MSAVTISKPALVLSLDGGGVLVLSSLLVLQRFMRQLHQNGNSSTLLPYQVFDLIVGTSAGGIIALMLGTLHMSVDDCIDVYARFAERVFAKPCSSSSITRGFSALLGWLKYYEHVLESALQEFVEQELGDKNAFLDSSRGCETAVITSSKDDGKHPVFFRSYDHPDEPATDCYVWQAARATSAATTVYPPVSIGHPPCQYIDGAISGHCNPGLLAVQEAGDLWPGRRVFLLSVGTGSPATITVGGQIIAVVKSLAELVTDCNSVHESLQKLSANNNSITYFRFAVGSELAKIHLDEWKEMGRITALTKGYLNLPDQINRMRLCVVQLRGIRVDQDPQYDSYASQ